MSDEEKKDFEDNSYKYKLHYYYRIFDLNIKSLKQDPEHPSAIDLSRIRNSKYVFGLAMTYHINYGLSTRQTASVLWDIHRVKMSHQTVANYSSAAARVIKPFVDNFPYELSEELAIVGDETYIKVLGKNHYVFFIMDALTKIITSYPVFKNRDGIAAIKAIYSTLSKFKKIPDDLVMVFDGNPIYILAKHFFAQYGIHFDIKQELNLYPPVFNPLYWFRFYNDYQLAPAPGELIHWTAKSVCLTAETLMSYQGLFYILNEKG